MSVDFEAFFRSILLPARWLMEQARLQPSDMEVWALMVAVFMLALAVPWTYGDLVLWRRGRRTTGEVISIDTSGDTDTARIAFRAPDGGMIEFDSSLSVNSRTSQVGATVDVVFDPLRPQRAREAGRRVLKWVTALLWYGFAFGLVVYALAGSSLGADRPGMTL